MLKRIGASGLKLAPGHLLGLQLETIILNLEALQTKNIEKAFVLQRFLAQGSLKCLKSIGFICLSGPWKPEMLKKHWF